jgi:diketogulonate reductase-like aldo/keto reductase
MPYNPEAPLDSQVKTSVASSLTNLRHQAESKESSFVDCMLLHSPLPTVAQTLDAWMILESYVPHQIRSLGISNVTLPVLQAIYDNSTVKPSVVQNRFYPQTKYDVPLRAFCKQHQIKYQSFWTLTGNPALLKSKPVVQLAQAIGLSPHVALYSLVMNLNIEVLNGTSSAEHMHEDLEGVERVWEWAAENAHDWIGITAQFEKLTGNNH